MKNTIIDRIIKEREQKNEKRLAIARLSVISVFFLFDILSLLNLFSGFSTNPSETTIILDSIFLLYSLSVVIVLFKATYFSFLKYITIAIDWGLVNSFILFDPTLIATQNYMIGALVFVMLYIISLLRYSKSASIYSGALFVVSLIWEIIKFQAYQDPNIVPLFISILIIILIGYYITMSNRKIIEEANTKKLMERYIAPQLVSELYKSDANLSPGGKNQVVTILFSDIRSFTSISEKMSAQEVVGFLNDYLSAMTEIIFQNEGTIDKFIGDAIMTVFGAPIQQREDSFRAVMTAVQMIRSLEKMNERHHLSVPLKIGIGIHTGEVVVGNIGSDKRMDYTVIGDAVNLTSRIEGLTKFYQCPILISDSTYNSLVEDKKESAFLIREIDRTIVKGKSEPVTIYEVMDYIGEDERCG